MVTKMKQGVSRVNGKWLKYVFLGTMVLLSIYFGYPKISQMVSNFGEKTVDEVAQKHVGYGITAQEAKDLVKKEMKGQISSEELIVRRDRIKIAKVVGVANVTLGSLAVLNYLNGLRFRYFLPTFVTSVLVGVCFVTSFFLTIFAKLAIGETDFYAILNIVTGGFYFMFKEFVAIEPSSSVSVKKVDPLVDQKRQMKDGVK